jgi:FAD/FMN-containing dehydrogenase
VSTGLPRPDADAPGLDATVRDLVFNQLPFGRRPDVVVRPRSEAEVVAAVRTAAEQGLRVAVLSGGHSWIGAPVRDGGMLLDLSAFDAVHVDAEARTLRVGPAARGGDVVAEVARHGLAYPTGHCGTPGSGGYLLGGGLGLNSGHWLPACYSVRRVRVVTADGRVLDATAEQHRDLWWLARGAGPCFPGVVTEFELDLQDRPADTRVSSWVFDFDDLAAVGRWVSEVSPLLSSRVEVFTAAGGPDRHDHLPGEGYPDRIVTVMAMAYVDSEQEAEGALAPFSTDPGVPVLAHGHLDAVAFEDLSSAFDAEYPEGHRYLADAFWSDLDVEGVMTPLQQVFCEAPSGMSNYVALMPGNGDLAGLPTETSAYSMDRRTLVMAYALWSDPAADDANRSWIRRVSAVLEPLSNGNFVSEADHEAHPQRLAASFSEESWARIAELREEWDPGHLFHRPGPPTS